MTPFHNQFGPPGGPQALVPGAHHNAFQTAPRNASGGLAQNAPSRPLQEPARPARGGGFAHGATPYEEVYEDGTDAGVQPWQPMRRDTMSPAGLPRDAGLQRPTDTGITTHTTAALAPKAGPVEEMLGLENYGACGAAAAGNTQIVKYYLATHPDHIVRPEKEQGGHYPLTLAAKHNQLHIVKLFLDNAKSLNARLSDGSEPFDINMTPTKKPGKTALYYAIKGNSQRLAAYLLAQGADPTLICTVDGERLHALDFAVRQKHGFIAVTLLRWSAAKGGAAPFNLEDALAKAKARCSSNQAYKFTVSCLENYRKNLIAGIDVGT